ncbi:PaaI family thioesterase [Nocardia niwae]|uniref:PaaI family thioesterase n=1 Tax=Nocardia niwae TaxID=626084 RepID=UPI0033EA6BB0
MLQPGRQHGLRDAGNATADSAMGSAVLSKLPAGLAYTTAQLNVHLPRPGTARTGTLRATGHAIHVGRSIGTAEAQLVGIEDGKLYAHATTTCAIFPIP